MTGKIQLLLLLGLTFVATSSYGSVIKTVEVPQPALPENDLTVAEIVNAEPKEQLEAIKHTSHKPVTGNPKICRGHAWNHHNQHTGDYLRPHSNCRKFWSCTAAGIPYEMKCPSGLHFDNKHKICNWPELAGCSGHGGGGGGDCDCSSDSCDDSCDCPPKTTEKPDCDCSSDSCDDSCDCPPKTTEKPDCDCSSDSCDDSCDCPPKTTEKPDCDCSSDSCDDSCECPPKTTEKPDCDCSSDSCDDSCDCPPKTTEKPDCDCSSDSCDDSCGCSDKIVAEELNLGEVLKKQVHIVKAPEVPKLAVNKEEVDNNVIPNV